jgi:hypothetical protein
MDHLLNYLLKMNEYFACLIFYAQLVTHLCLLFLNHSIIGNLLPMPHNKVLSIFGLLDLFFLAFFYINFVLAVVFCPDLWNYYTLLNFYVDYYYYEYYD